MRYRVFTEPRVPDDNTSGHRSIEVHARKEFRHRDLKPSNIFVTQPAPQWWLKVADFGLSKRHAEFTDIHTTLSGGSELPAPELTGLTGGITMTSAVDMWFTGCI